MDRVYLVYYCCSVAAAATVAANGVVSTLGFKITMNNPWG